MTNFSGLAVLPSKTYKIYIGRYIYLQEDEYICLSRVGKKYTDKTDKTDNSY